MNIKNIHDINSFDDDINFKTSINQKESNNDILKETEIKNFSSISSKEKDEIENNNINNINFNDNNEEKDQIKNDNNNNNNNNVIISNLLYELKKMSDKQLYLLDIISNLQKNSSEQINALNKRIKNLEEKLINKNNNYNNNDEQNYEYEDNNLIKEDNNNPNYILTKLLNGNNHDELIRYLNELNLHQIKKLDLKLIEDTLIKLCILLTEGFKVHEIICFIKGILIINKIKLKDITKKNLKDVFNFVQQNLSNLKDEDSVDISLIISYLNI